MADLTKTAVFTFYRTFRRQINLLPSEYLRQFFRIKLADDVRNVLAVPEYNEKLRRTKFKRAKKELRKLEAAHAGNPEAYAHVLDVAYARKGKLRQELMEPLLTDPNAPLPNRIIPAVEKSRPPVYSPELTALLGSGISRDTPLSAKALKNPPLLSERVDRNSEQARLLGPLSKRREVNIRWRFFTDGWRKTLPPLEVGVAEPASAGEIEPIIRTDKASLDNAGIRPVGLQYSGVLEDLVSSAGPPCILQPQTRRERATSPSEHETLDTAHRPLPRFIRRRMRQVLTRIPILTFADKARGTDKGRGSRSSKGSQYGVSLSPNALDGSTRYGSLKIPPAHSPYLAWVDAVSGRR